MEEILRYVGGPIGVIILGSVVAMSAFLISRLKAIQPAISLEAQSEIVEGEPSARRSKFCVDGQLVRYIYGDAKTIYEAFKRGVKISGSGPCLGWRPSASSPYSWLSYNEVIKRAEAFGAGLVRLGLKSAPTTFVGIYSQNRVEWILTEMGLYSQSMVIVPLYDTLGSDACAFIINQAEINTVVCDKAEKIGNLLEQSTKAPSLKRIIYIDVVPDIVLSRATDCGVQLISFKEVMSLHEEHPIICHPPLPSDLATICYTSGTTGSPKGVILTHENVIADVSAVLINLRDDIPTSQDCLVSFLPLAHMLERVCEVAFYMVGGRVGFYMGDIKTLMDDLKTLQPTCVPAVPRLLNRIYDMVHTGVSGSLIKSKLLSMALRSKEAELKRGIVRRNSIWDTIIFRKIQNSFGGRCRLMVIGSAPLAANVLTFIRCSMGCTVLEGYGQTECVAPSSLTVKGDMEPGHVGPPIPCNIMKLVDVPEMEYYASNNQGEVCIKGTNVFQGYFKDPDKTIETLDKDGWLHTGDIGMWLPNGTLKIVDRKKHIFKLSQGEYIAPEKIENIYVRSPFVGQIFVHGDSLKSTIIAIIVPDADYCLVWAKSKGYSRSMPEFCKNPAVKKTVMDDLIALGKKSGLHSFEQIKDIYLHPEMFSVENNLLTPTLKTRRPELRKYFNSQIEEMYRTLA